MAFLNMLDKVDDFFYKPMETICNWLEEPLKHFAHNRSMTEEEKKHELERIDREHAAQLELDMEKAKLELEELRKDKDFEREEKIFKTLQKYQTDVAEASVENANAIGSMTIELRKKAKDYVKESMKEFNELIKEAKLEAREELKQIGNDFSEGSEAYEILKDAIKMQLKSTIKNAKSIIKEIKDDLKNINSSVDNITGNTTKTIDKILNKSISNMSGTPALDENGNETRRLN